VIQARALEIDGADLPNLDPRAVVLGRPHDPALDHEPTPTPTSPAVLWEGSITGDGTGPQAAYYVRLYTDGAAHCQCPDQYFRGVLRLDRTFACKHIRRAQLAVRGSA